MTKPEADPDRDAHAAGLYRAMALRHYCRYLDARRRAHHRGEDLQGPLHDVLPTDLQVGEEYKYVVDEWLTEPVSSAGAVLALIEFAATIAADRIAGEALRESFPVSDEVDALHQTIALASAGEWFYQNIVLEEWLEKRQAAYGPSGLSPAERGGAA